MAKYIPYIVFIQQRYKTRWQKTSRTKDKVVRMKVNKIKGQSKEKWGTNCQQQSQMTRNGKGITRDIILPKI